MDRYRSVPQGLGTPALYSLPGQAPQALVPSVRLRPHCRLYPDSSPKPQAQVSSRDPKGSSLPGLQHSGGRTLREPFSYSCGSFRPWDGPHLSTQHTGHQTEFPAALEAFPTNLPPGRHGLWPHTCSVIHSLTKYLWSTRVMANNTVLSWWVEWRTEWSLAGRG